MSKSTLTDEEILAQLDSLGNNTPSTNKPSKPTTTITAAAGVDDDPLASLEALANAKAPQSSRPATPKLTANIRRGQPAASESGTSVGAIATPSSTASARNSSEVKKDGADDEVAGSQPATNPSEQQGSWWGGFFATANAVKERAEAAVKEIQQNEDAQKWADQVRGNAGFLTSLSGELTSRALPTFNNILNTIAPPISQHERLQIHITHDLIGYPALDPTIYSIFSRVMSQVEGGDLLVIQRGSESRGVSGSSSKAGWSDGPWWRDTETKRDMGIVDGLREGTKLARASAEAFATEHYAARGGLEFAIKQANEIQSESNPVRSSDVFLALQAIGISEEGGLYEPTSPQKESGDMVEEEDKDERVCFAIYLHDPIHGITFRTVTQSFPRKWAEWLDAETDAQSDPQLPTDIAEIVLQGGIDPREWVSEWVEEAIGLGVGVIAQRYVAKRMGVGEGGIGKGKARQPAIESGAGELARAI